MKIYNKLVISIETGETLYEDSFDYSGPVEECKGGGGGSSGAVSHSAYLEAAHGSWLNLGGADTITQSITASMSAAFVTSPYVSTNALNPAAELAAMDAAVTTFRSALAALDNEADWASAMDAAEAAAVDSSYINAEVASYEDQLDDSINDNVLPVFKSNIRDVGAVMTSAFVIGESLIWSRRNRDVAKFTSELRLRRAEMVPKIAEHMVIYLGQITDQKKQLMHYTIEANRLRIIAEKEQVEQDALYNEKDALWDLEIYQYGANLLAGISGGVSTPMDKKKSPVASAIAGGLSGAAAGAMIGSSIGASAATTTATTAGSTIATSTTTGASTGGYWGAAIGAVVGIGLALMD